MEYEYDPAKAISNLAKHEVSFEEALMFDWDSALVEDDVRFDYPEPRFKATGYIGPRLHVMIFCLRGDARRIISLRKANPREERHYARTQT